MIRIFYIPDDLSGGGGDPITPTAPKGYTPTTPQMRSDWNAFLDYAGKQPGANLSDTKQQAALLASYKKANPNFSITAEQIPAIQYEGYQLRKGDKFGNLGAKELGYIRQGLRSDFLNADTSNVGKLYYPQEGGYGTDLENYYNAKFNPSAVTASPQASTGGGSSKVQKVAAPANQGQPESAAGGTLPGPYQSHDTALKRVQELAKLPGNEFLHNRGDALINASYVPSTDTQSFHQSVLDAAKAVNIDPAILWGSGAEEGITGLIPDKNGQIATDPKIDLNGKFPVSGFANFGLDNFHGNFKELVRRGYLPKDLEYEKSPQVNEMGQKVVSGNFKTVADAMRAKAAYVRMEQDNLEDWAKTDGGGVKLSPMARQFFTLIAFNGGPGRAHTLINYYKKKGWLEGDQFLQHPPENKDLDPKDSYGNVLPRIKMAMLMKKEKLFD